MADTFDELIGNNIKLYKECAPKFYKLFGFRLAGAFWNNITGLDIVALDDYLQTPDGVSMKDWIIQKYGQEASDLIIKLIDAEE